jgi:hypothetical protein
MSKLSRTVGVLLCVLASAGFAQATRDKTIGRVHVSGRVVDAKGRPLGYVFLSLTPVDRSDKAAGIAVTARYDGVVVFSGIQPKKYKLAVPGGQFKVSPSVVEVGPTDDVEIGDIAVQPDVTSDLRLEQIIVDPVVIKASSIGMRVTFPPGIETWAMSLPDIERTSSQPLGSAFPLCSVHSDRYKTVEAFVGGKVKAIRAVRLLGPNESGPAEIQSRIMSAWHGVFRTADCFMEWSELRGWNLEASIEYEDGKRTSMLIDSGIHVQVQDREGRVWFIRLWPSD